MRVSDLDEYLLRRFPIDHAEPWDHVGLACGVPCDRIDRVAVALDASDASIKAAAELGANVLVTHHPVYIKAPDAFVSEGASYPSSSLAIFHAIERGVSVLSYHTNLDRSHEARRVLADKLGLTPESSLEFPDNPEKCGLGSICTGEPVSLDGLVSHCARAFHTDPRVWGEPNRRIERVAILGGSLGGFGESALRCGADVIVAGEAGYHVAQDLNARGCDVILLGHDRSEEPFTAILMDAVRCAGIDEDRICRIGPSRQWWTRTEQEQL